MKDLHAQSAAERRRASLLQKVEQPLNMVKEAVALGDAHEDLRVISLDPRCSLLQPYLVKGQ